MAYVAEEEEEDPEEVEPWISSDSEPDEHPAPEPRSPSPDTEPEQPPPPAPQSPPAPTNSASEAAEEGQKAAPWPGFPGASVFRLVVAGDKVGGLIGRRGEIVKRLCEVTRARVRVLDAADGVSSRIVLISATEETQAELAPAMDATVRIFKHVNDIEGINPDVTLSASAPEICCARLLVPKAQAVHLIGKQGTMIKLMQETTGVTIRIIDQDDLLSNQMVVERIVEIRGASLKVLNALKSVLGLLRKFLVDHSVLHLFERKNQAMVQVQDSSEENQVTVTNGYALPVNQDLLLSDSRSPLNMSGSRYLLYGRGPSVCDPYSSDIRHPTVPLIPKITQTMQIPLLQAEEIIGVRGRTIAHIRSVSGAVVVLEETGNYLDEVLVSIKGTSSQVQTAHQLIQVLLGDRKVLPPRSSGYGNPDAGPVRPRFDPCGAPASPEYAPPLYSDYLSSSSSVRHYHSAAYHGYRL
ncbi:unnamed protein product [Triticum turgidum subsp. durum]|uniref:K Homology domain-containing protein n=1 Tax=Triticum turgidum subsp. durum TaxID=4567 RepID=A0A9R1B7R2_TRITD|nr:unnamed protein product [Triticum turgidum subsp. durum]